MAYDGEFVPNPHLVPGDFTMVYAVVVTGSWWNPCGHMILKTPAGYFHIAERKGRPKRMTEEGYKRYLAENGKKELSRTYLHLPEPGKAHKKLVELLGKDWAWWLLPNNCAAFVEDIVKAGGSSAGLYSNCPSREKFK